jgi:5-deoxy-glucuronate isomerase
MQRHIKSQPGRRYQEIVSPGTMRFLDFARLQLASGERYSGTTGAREAVVDVFSGTASIAIDYNGGARRFDHAGGRTDVFSGPPVMVYVPSQARYEIIATSAILDAGLFSAPADTDSKPALMEGPAVKAREIGHGNWRRTVYSALDQETTAQRLLAGETLNPPGNWSSYPPHKHDRNKPPNEAVLEEIYFFRIKPAQGYGFIWTYTSPDDAEGFSTVFVVEDGDTVLLPKGYHPVVAAPGYQLHYTWVLAGEERRYGAWSDDPRHAWVKDAS